MTMKVLISAMTALVMVLAVSPMAFASSSVPFGGSAAGTFTMTTTTATATGTGNFEHMGLTTVSATASFTGASTCGAFTATEQDVYTAANGDAISFFINDVFCSTSSPGVLQVTGSFQVVGGTGRFADATGSGTIQGTATLVTPTSGTFTETTTGTISY